VGKFIEHRIFGRRVLPLIQKWLRAGIIRRAGPHGRKCIRSFHRNIVPNQRGRKS
jgi:hypothetical protein